MHHTRLRATNRPVPRGGPASGDTVPTNSVPADPVAVAQHAFHTDTTYLDTATVGLPPTAAVRALRQAVAAWGGGRADLAGYDEAVSRARALFARLVGVSAHDVAVGSQSAVFVGLIAAGLPSGAEVLAPENDFTSLLFPFLARPDLTVRLAPLAELAARVRPSTSLVAFSAVQSADGDRADLVAINTAARAHQARTLVDLTQAAGWLPVSADEFDYTVCSAYKWLMCPRGVAFLTVRPERRPDLTPIHANWYAGEDVWASIYGGPLRLAADARRFDLSPAWLCWVGAGPALGLIEQVGVERIGAHDVALARRFRSALGLPENGSPIVAVRPRFEPSDGGDLAQRLAHAGLRAGVRAGRVRLAFHLYNTAADVDRAVIALAELGAAS